MKRHIEMNGGISVGLKIEREITMSQPVSLLGDIVREMRKNKYMSQELLAEKIGVCKRTIIDIEKNTANPKFEILYMLVRELDLPLMQIFYPELSKNIKLRETLIQEISNCSADEIELVLAIVKSVRKVLKNTKEC